MWFEFFVSALLCAVFLYLPGYVLLRTARLSRVESMVFAPFVDVSAYSLLAAGFAMVGVSSSWISLSVPVLLAALVAFLICRFRFGGCLSKLKAPSWRNAACLCLYIAIGIAVSAMVFVPSLTDADAFVREYDNIHHLGITYGYLNSSDWSSFHNTLYPAGDDEAIYPFVYSGYYPSAWNCIAAMGAQVAGASAPMAVNAMNFCISAFVVPISVYSFMRVSFANKPSVVPFGALFCVAFNAFPWTMLVYGPLYPNMFAFGLVPAMVAGFALVTRSGVARVRRLGLAFLFCIALFSCVFTQPNAVFSTGVLLVPFCLYRISTCVDERGHAGRKGVALKVLFGALFVLLAGAVWYLLCCTPFLQGVVTHYWPALRTTEGAIGDVLAGYYRLDVPQLLLSAIVLVGIVRTLIKRRYLWLTLSWLLANAIYVICISSDDPMKQFVSGFWYNDSLRVAAMAAIAAIPLAAFGLHGVVAGITALFGRFARVKNGGKSRIVLLAVVSAAVIFAVYRPVSTVSMRSDALAAFSDLASTLHAMYNPQGYDVYEREEREFVQEAKDLIPEGALVLNVADDGSAFAYATDDLNIYYRYLSDYDTDYETEDSKLIRNGLANIAEDDAVRDAVHRSGAEYVLFLDWGDDALSPVERKFFFTYGDGGKWQGMLAIDESTPGFELILAKGDMRLYRITA